MDRTKLYCLLKLKKGRTRLESFVFSLMDKPIHEDYIHTLFVLRDEGYIKDIETIVHDKEGREFLASFPNRNFVFTDKGVKAVPALIRKYLLSKSVEYLKKPLGWLLKILTRSLVLLGFLYWGFRLIQ